MFRGCYFKFAGKSSEIYNLMLFYKDNANDNFKSGGEFELRTDSVVGAYDQLLYGKNYSDAPLEFEVEIVTPEGNIPMEQMIGIKNWLYGQDGWRDLTITDDTQKYHLKCVLIPIEDITDKNGYRGVRCTIHNASPFWYGNTKEITISNATLTSGYDPPSKWFGWTAFEVNIPKKGNYVDCDIYPEIIIKTDRHNVNPFAYGKTFSMANTDESTLADGRAKTSDGKNFLNEETSRIQFDGGYLENNAPMYSFYYSYDETLQKHLIYLIDNEGDEYFWEMTDVSETPTDDQIKAEINDKNYRIVTYVSATKSGTAVQAGEMRDIVSVNTRFAHIQSTVKYPDIVINPDINLDLPKPMFKLHYGINICRFYYGWAYENITFRYTPLLRMGAF